MFNKLSSSSLYFFKNTKLSVTKFFKINIYILKYLTLKKKLVIFGKLFRLIRRFRFKKNIKQFIFYSRLLVNKSVLNVITNKANGSFQHKMCGYTKHTRRWPRIKRKRYLKRVVKRFSKKIVWVNSKKTRFMKNKLRKFNKFKILLLKSCSLNILLLKKSFKVSKNFKKVFLNYNNKKTYNWGFIN